MKILTTKKFYCDCLKKELSHFICEDSNKKVFKVCPLCDKMTEIKGGDYEDTEDSNCKEM